MTVFEWLENHSTMIDRVSWIDKKDINFSQIGKDLGITRQTASTQFKKLLGDIVFFDEESERYRLKDAVNISKIEILNNLSIVLNNQALEVFKQVLKRYILHGSVEFEFNAKEIESKGIVVTNILDILERLNLLYYQLIAKRGIYKILWVRDSLPERVERPEQKDILISKLGKVEVRESDLKSWTGKR